MRLKSVELYGFKSFPDRTTIEFGDGVNAILGPNGCGKSNVVDAIKWVLGEKSAKNLRGEEMLDVIFSGCETRSASGMAEVRLNFDNTDGSLPLPYSEVSISRSLTRAKESEYSINRRPCLLKDIRNLFLDTGVGGSAYSVIEQGRVEALLSAKPADRRAVFEEAAGIAKFKVRRKEILARLERTSQTLLRLSDRVEEKEKQIRKVSAQAAAARRHRRLTADRDAARSLLYRRQYAAQKTLLQDIQIRRTALERELDLADRDLAALNLEFTRLSEEETSLAAERDKTLAAAATVQDELGALQLEQAGARNRVESLRDEINRGNQRRSELSARMEALLAREAETRERLERARVQAAELEERFSQQDRERRDLAQAAADAERRVGELRGRILDLNRRRQTLSDEATRLEAAEQSGAKRLEELDARLARLRAEEEALAKQVEELDASYQRAATDFNAAADRLEEMRARSRELTAAAEKLQAEERSLESERAAKASRRATLEDLENSFAGAFEGVRNILLAARENHPDCRGVVGMAIDLMTVPQDLALAVETILGGSAQDVVVETARNAQAAIEHLKRNRLGRATFLPMDRIQPRRRLDRNFKHIPGVIGEAVELVSFDRRHSTVMEHLLAGVLVVDSLDLARDLAGREARGVKIVTVEGDVVSPSGAMTGGHGKQRPAGLVQRKAELDALTGDLADCERRLTEKARQRADAMAAVRDLSQKSAEIEKFLAEAGRSEAGLKQNLAGRRNELARLSRDRAESETERQTIDQGGGGRRDELENLRRELAANAEEMATLEKGTEAGVAEQRRTREAMDALGQEFAGLSGERSAALAQVAELENRLREAAVEKSACQEELDRPGLSSGEAETEIARLTQRLAFLAENEANLLRLRDERRATGTELAERLQECRTRAESLRQREREGQTQATRVREGLSLLDRQTAECGVRLQTVRDKAREDLGVEDLDPEEKAAAHGEEEAAPDALPAPEREPAAKAPDPTEAWQHLSDAELQTEIDSLTQKIRSCGNVNPDAIDELAELEAGAEFLRSHKEEQEEAVASMRSAVEKLNQESSARFQETFAAVRTNFQQLFASLFGGGRADLVLELPTEPGADPLDAGIDIAAQPPGKEPKSISLLSGGEKALCAVALLFALFRSKPSPFCILDEVDGPLDESNIDRFMRQVRDFSSDTQFVIITHSLRTMSMVDRIWGVSQETPGISRLTSLEFQRMEEMSREKPLALSREGSRTGKQQPMTA